MGERAIVTAVMAGGGVGGDLIGSAAALIRHEDILRGSLLGLAIGLSAGMVGLVILAIREEGEYRHAHQMETDPIREDIRIDSIRRDQGNRPSQLPPIE